MQIGRVSNPSKYKEGETYEVTTVIDQTGRRLTATGNWAKDWKQGDEIEVNVESSKWFNKKTGIEETSLRLVDPNKKPWVPRANPNWYYAYDLALKAMTYAGQFKAFDNATLTVLDKWADYFKFRIEKGDVAQIAPQTLSPQATGMSTSTMGNTAQPAPIDDIPIINENDGFPNF